MCCFLRCGFDLWRKQVRKKEEVLGSLYLPSLALFSLV